MNKLNTFTSTGSKLLFHTDVVNRIREEGIATPISLQVAPTSRCNLSCSFCSNTNREKHEDLDIEDLMKVLYRLKRMGLKTVEWTGGGDPTIYEGINEVILYAMGLGLEQGFITNGVLLKQMLSKSALEALKWVRVSLNSLDYQEPFDLPEISGTLGFSYVMNDDTNGNSLFQIQDYVNKYHPDYVRIVPNCQSTFEEQEESNRVYSKYFGKFGKPYFYQSKTFETPERCWWGYLKPFLHHSGFIYPCSSVVLNNDSERQFHDKYRWYHMNDVEEFYSQEMSNFDPSSCSHCVFTSQNNMVDSLIHPSNMRNFI